MKRVIVLVADDNYVDHAKALVMCCKKYGSWIDDFAFVCPSNSRAAETFSQKGFKVCLREAESFLQKFYVFDDFFRQWDQVLYMDCDVIVQSDLYRLFSLLASSEKPILMDTEDLTTLETFWRDEHKIRNAPLYARMQLEFPHITQRTFNSAFMLFRPNELPVNTVNKLFAVQTWVSPANVINSEKDSCGILRGGGTDQQIINLVLYSYIAAIPSKFVCYWAFDEGESRVVPSRGWTGTEIPVALHYSRWYAPWIEKVPHAGAYMVHRLEESAYNIYQENLKDFEAL